MAKLLSLFLLLTGLQGHTLGPVVSATRDSVVHVESNEMLCTGFAVGLTHFLTVKHCVPDKGDVLVAGYVARVVKSNVEFALLEIPDTGFKPLKIAKGVVQGEYVASLGYANGQTLMAYGRHIAGTSIEGYLVLDGPITRGMSGGPVVNEQGEVVGINQATSPDRGYICPASELRTFLK